MRHRLLQGTKILSEQNQELLGGREEKEKDSDEVKSGSYSATWHPIFSSRPMPTFNEFAKYSCNLRAAAGGDGTGNAGEPAAMGGAGGTHPAHHPCGPSRVQSQGQDGGAFLHFFRQGFHRAWLCCLCKG